MIIEDDILMMDIYSTALAAAGCRVFKAWDGEEGLRLVAENCPSAILLDLIMPKVTGFEVLEKLKADQATRGIPVLVLSNLVDDVNIKQAMDRGAERFLPKTGYTPAEITKTVLEYLAK